MKIATRKLFWQQAESITLYSGILHPIEFVSTAGNWDQNQGKNQGQILLTEDCGSGVCKNSPEENKAKQNVKPNQLELSLAR